MKIPGYRTALAALLVLAACSGETAQNEAGAEPGTIAMTEGAEVQADTVVVYKSPTCGCCTKWVDHMRENGFTVVTHDTDELNPIKSRLGVPAGHASCHTATVGGYTVEGHVPADLVQRMLAEKPSIRGLAVPGMPMGSPGMEGLMKQEYDVLAFDSAGHSQVYAKR